jgi:hypothetical protein
MRHLAFAFALLALSACGERQTSSTAAGCERVASHDVTWSDANAPDTITARSEGPTCAQAAVIFVTRNADGDPLWAFASTYFNLAFGGAPPDGAAVSTEQMDEFLAGWANVSATTSNTLPEWREGVATLSESAMTFSYDTPFDRETYEMLRARNLRMICYAAAVEGTQCLVIDPLSNAPMLIVAYGP